MAAAAAGHARPGSRLRARAARPRAEPPPPASCRISVTSDSENTSIMREGATPSMASGYSTDTHTSPWGRRTWARFAWRRSGGAVLMSRPTWLPMAVAAVPVICVIASATAESEASSRSVPC